MDKTYGKLKLYTEQGGKVREIIQLLTSVESAYNNLYALDFIIRNRNAERSSRLEYSFQYKVSDRTEPIPDVDGLILPEDRLQITSIVIRSPGFWEFLGSLNPLQQIREYLNDRHEQSKDRKYRERRENDQLRLENERQQLENEKLKTILIRERIELLKEAGFEPEEIRRLLIKYAIEPLGELDQYVSRGLISNASVKRHIIDPMERPDRRNRF